jgi:hypothetical protein
MFFLKAAMIPARLHRTKFSDPDWARTNNLQLRRLTLYPIELQGHVGVSIPHRFEAVNAGIMDARPTPT